VTGNREFVIVLPFSRVVNSVAKMKEFFGQGFFFFLPFLFPIRTIRDLPFLRRVGHLASGGGHLFSPHLDQRDVFHQVLTSPLHFFSSPFPFLHYTCLLKERGIDLAKGPRPPLLAEFHPLLPMVFELPERSWQHPPLERFTLRKGSFFEISSSPHVSVASPVG